MEHNEGGHDNVRTRIPALLLCLLVLFAAMPAHAGQDLIVGTWCWGSNDYAATFSPTGFARTNKGQSGRWRRFGNHANRFQIKWDGGNIDNVYVTNTGQLKGVNQGGYQWQAWRPTTRVLVAQGTVNHKFDFVTEGGTMTVIVGLFSNPDGTGTLEITGNTSGGSVLGNHAEVQVRLLGYGGVTSGDLSTVHFPVLMTSEVVRRGASAGSRNNPFAWSQPVPPHVMNNFNTFDMQFTNDGLVAPP